MRLPQTLDTANPYNERARSFAMPGNSFVLLGWPILKECQKIFPSVNVNLILYKKWKIILYNFQLFSGWLSRNARLSFSL